MIILELSAGQGPAECCEAVRRALTRVMHEAEEQGLSPAILEEIAGPNRCGLQSVSILVEGTGAAAFAKSWEGSMLWVCASPFRPHCGRKNWYFAGAIYALPETGGSQGVRVETMRSSGAGGQHVNKTESAVRVTHLATGISVRVGSERSQHANRKLAMALLARRLDQRESELQDELRARRRLFHHQLERGNPGKVFRGERFTLDP